MRRIAALAIMYVQITPLQMQLQNHVIMVSVNIPATAAIRIAAA